MPQKKTPEQLRSARWFGANDLRSFGHRSRAKQAGFDAPDYVGKPVIGIFNTWSELNSCHMHLKLTADAVAGEFGEVCEARAIEFLEKGWVSVLASDAHDTETRPPRLTAGLEVASRILGREAAQKLVDGNPRRIVYGA